MGRQRSFLLVGLPHTGVPLLTAALEQHREVLAGRRKLGRKPAGVG